MHDEYSSAAPLSPELNCQDSCPPVWWRILYRLQFRLILLYIRQRDRMRALDTTDDDYPGM